MPYCVAGVENLNNTENQEARRVRTVIRYLHTENQSEDSRSHVSRAFSSLISRLFLKAATVLLNLEVSGICYDDG